jgi:hypothetical protein
MQKGEFPKAYNYPEPRDISTKEPGFREASFGCFDSA